MFRRISWPVKIIFFIAMGALFVFGIGALVFHLWNYLVPTLFHGPTITYVQAFLLLILARILVGGIGGSGRKGGGRCKGGMGHGGWGRHQNDWQTWWETNGKESYENWKKENSTPKNS